MEKLPENHPITHRERHQSGCCSQVPCIRTALLIIGALGVVLLAAALMDYIQIDWALLGWGLVMGSALGLFLRCVWGGIEKGSRLTLDTDKAEDFDFLDFYLGEGRDETGRTFDDYLNKKFGFHDMEHNHTYIQKLFPNPRQSGAVRNAHKLTIEECEKIKKSEKGMQRLWSAYRKMLWFYGFERVVEEDNSVKFIEVKSLEKNQLNWLVNKHNLKRMTRIIVFLKLLGLKDERNKEDEAFLFAKAITEVALRNVETVEDGDQLTKAITFWNSVLACDNLWEMDWNAINVKNSD